MPTTSQSPPGDLGGQAPPPSEEDLLTVAEVAAMWRVSRWTVNRAIKSGALRTVQLGRYRRVPRAALREFNANTSAGPAVAPAGPAERNEQ
jgi:excisionase family DNA binding protein